MLKKDLRSYFFQKRKQMSPIEISLQSLWIHQNFIQNIPIKNYNNIHIYYGLSHEVQTKQLVDKLCQRGKNIFMPVIKGDDLMSYQYQLNTEVISNRYGILEPIGDKPYEGSLEVIIVPLLAYDKNFHRVGYGKGYYDRFLKNFSDTLKVGFSFEEPVDKIIDIHEFDVPLDMVITPYQIYKKN